MRKTFMAAAALALAGTAHADIISDTSWDNPDDILGCLFNGEAYNSAAADSPCSAGQAGWLQPGGDVFIPNEQYKLQSYFSFTSTGNAFADLVVNIAGLAEQTNFGIFEKGNAANYDTIFTGGAPGALSIGLTSSADIRVEYADFGFFLDVAGTRFYSDPLLNGGAVQMVGFEGDGSYKANFGNLPDGMFLDWESEHWILAWEDLLQGTGDDDYNDLVVSVSPISAAVPAPAAFGLLGMGLVAIAVVRRRRMA